MDGWVMDEWVMDGWMVVHVIPAFGRWMQKEQKLSWARLESCGIACAT